MRIFLKNTEEYKTLPRRERVKIDQKRRDKGFNQDNDGFWVHQFFAPKNIEPLAKSLKLVVLGRQQVMTVREQAVKNCFSTEYAEKILSGKVLPSREDEEIIQGEIANFLKCPYCGQGVCNCEM